jgi:hypothetical protein
MPRLPGWAWVLVAIVFASMATYVGVRWIKMQPMLMKSAQPAPKAMPPQPGSKRFGGGVIRDKESGEGE